MKVLNLATPTPLSIAHQLAALDTTRERLTAMRDQEMQRKAAEDAAEHRKNVLLQSFCQCRPCQMKWFEWRCNG